MGRKRIDSGDPSDKADRDVMETVIALDEKPELPVGIRVIVKFLR
jgi:hypothetical protein